MSERRDRRVLRTAAAVLAFGLASPAAAEGTGGPAPGPYLAGLAAAEAAEFEAAVPYLLEAMESGAPLPRLADSAIGSLISLGRIDEAVEIARGLDGPARRSHLAAMTRNAAAAAAGDWAGLLAALDRGESGGPLVDGLMRGWAELGLGRTEAALAAFDEVIADDGLRGFGLYHKALALSVAGQDAAAEAIFAAGPASGLPVTRRGAKVHAEILGRLGRPEAALEVLDTVFGTAPDPMLADLREALASEAPPPRLVADIRTGMAEVHVSVGSALEGQMSDGYVLLHARLAEHLHPGLVDAVMLSGGVFDRLGRHDLAHAAFDSVPDGHPAHLAASLGRVDSLRAAGKREAAVSLLEELIARHPGRASLRKAMGDALRALGRHREAAGAYGEALRLYPEEARDRWFVHYARGIMRHRIDDWTGAETDLRRALILNPEQPQVLNYLGYSLVERGEHLDEALRMIETAVAAEPDNGAIVDSLGWVLYRLGRVREALPHMEQAAALEPMDAVVNDHLGDVYWSAGRRTEARFQWARALSLDPEGEEAERIRAKLDRGLDAVIAEERREAAAPVRIVTAASPSSTAGPANASTPAPTPTRGAD